MILMYSQTNRTIFQMNLPLNIPYQFKTTKVSNLYLEKYSQKKQPHQLHFTFSNKDKESKAGEATKNTL